MDKSTPKIDFDTMRANCIQIHQETYLMLKVAKHIGEDLNLLVKEADELRTHPETKSWDGMGRFAKDLHDNAEVWDKLPVRLWVEGADGRRVEWIKEKSRAELLDCYYHLGGKNLYTKKNAQDILFAIITFLPARNMIRATAEKYVDDPKLADQFLRELHVQTLANRETCVSSWSEGIVKDIEQYVKETK